MAQPPRKKLAQYAYSQRYKKTGKWSTQYKSKKPAWLWVADWPQWPDGGGHVINSISAAATFVPTVSHGPPVVMTPGPATIRRMTHVHPGTTSVHAGSRRHRRVLEYEFHSPGGAVVRLGGHVEMYHRDVGGYNHHCKQPIAIAYYSQLLYTMLQSST